MRVLRRRTERLPWHSRSDMRTLVEVAEQRLVDLHWRVQDAGREGGEVSDYRWAELERRWMELRSHLALLTETLRGRSADAR